MKKGSALLVVLGMLAFMLISAVSFSAYMRYARLPSSFLRRSSASRMLAKAALAEAIDEIDAAIGNNPHPGFGTRQPRSGAGSLNAGKNGIQNENMQCRNTWLHRVYIGTNAVNEADLQSKLADPDETVSTLTLEGLAYIPPALVNEARYYSRRSRAGIWKPLGFDSGRYAFCAIDVSDLFDVNVLSAKVPRNSSPSGRISLSYLFEGVGHTDYDQDPKEWDKFLENDAKIRQMSAAEAEVKNQDLPAADASHVPFVSVADLNLAINDKKPLGWESPFCKFIEGGGNFMPDYSGDMANNAKRQSFITDSLFPRPSTALASKDTDLCDISNFDEQPFDELAMLSDNYPLDWFETNPEGWKSSAKRIAKSTSAFGLVALYDYLDANNIPISLALPTTERAPMICGIGTDNMMGAVLKLKDPVVKDKVTPKDLNTQIKTRTTTYMIDGDAFSTFIESGTIKVVLTYPFRRGVDLAPVVGADPFKFALEGQLAVFFYTDNEEPVGFRNGGDPRDKNAQLRAAPEWFTDAAKFDKGVLRIPLKFEGAKEMTFRNVQTEEDAVVEQDCILSQSEGARDALKNYLDEHPLLTVTEEWEQTKVTDAMGNISWTPENPPDKSVTSAISDISVMHPGGQEKVMGNLANKDYSLKKNLVVASAIWLRVKNGIDKTVDLVPASTMDDVELNGGNTANAALIADAVGKTPLMLTRATVVDNVLKPLVVSVEDLKAFSEPIPLDFTMNVQCIDPRWNWAPEHWYKCGSAVTKKTWLNAVSDFLDSDDAAAKGRDNDIFLMTSDAGYMQSVYELAFLPRFTNFGSIGNNQVYGNMDALNTAFNDFVSNPEVVMNRNLMWRSYHPYQMGMEAATAPRDPFENLRIVNDGGGFRINPYSADVNVLMAAFANTPVDWWAASLTTGNSLAQGKGLMRYVSENEKLDAETFNDHYTFNQISPDASNESRMFVWEELEQIARHFKELVRKHIENDSNVSSEPWMDVFDGVAYNDRPTGKATDSTTMSLGNQLGFGDWMEWDNGITFGGANTLKLLGRTDRQLYDVDRKFLYGYWRECFAAKQQLFLVFVRAEPTMMGGGSKGATPPQLGARAVALVWRDPTASDNESAPHRTRVLFYRQFD